MLALSTRQTISVVFDDTTDYCYVTACANPGIGLLTESEFQVEKQRLLQAN